MKLDAARRWPLLLCMFLLALIAPGGLSKPEADPEEPPSLEWPEEGPILRSEPIGYLPTSTSVGPSGEYRISVPLDVPPGTAGMAPALALSYGSEGGNDIAGVGWSLSGTSLLQRCSATFATDGFTDGVDFMQDRLCLDGAKLVAVAGAYGAVGTEYRTEQDPFSRIVGSESLPDGEPAKFTVYHPGGRVSIYEPVQSIQSSHAFAYLLAETHDRNGNGIHYDYLVDDQSEGLGGLSVLLLDITYTHHNLLDGQRSVIFHYDDRPDPSFAYVSGVRTRRDKRLSRIEMRAPNPVWPEAVWSYELEYETSPDTARSLLKSIRKQDGDSRSLWEKRFDWAHHKRPSFDLQVLPPELQEPIEPWAWDLARVLPVDLNGEGGDELLYQLWGFADAEARMRTTQSPALPLQGNSYQFDQDITEIALGRPIDRQNDGRMEVLARDMDEPAWPLYRPYRWDAAGEHFVEEIGIGAAAMNAPVVADFNGDGWSDTLFVPDHFSGETVNWQLALGGPGGFSDPIDTGVTDLGAEPQRAGDIDGDGRGDVILVDWSDAPEALPPGYYPSHTVAIRVNDAGAIVKAPLWDLGDSRGIVLADLNGDGLKDAVDLSGHGIGTLVRYNRGEGFGPPVLFTDILVYPAEAHAGVRVADFDRDGREDFLIFREDEFTPNMAVYLSRPDGFEEVVLSHVPHRAETGGWDTLKVGDFNGDGLPDIVDLIEDKVGDDRANAHLELLIQTAGEADVITGVRDEHAQNPRETISYTRTFDRMPGDDGCVFPQRCLLRGLRFVDQVETFEQDSAIPQRRMRYRYAGGRSDVRGRGFLGFGRVIADDLDSHARTVTTYDNLTRDGTTYPFAGLPATTETITPILSQRGSEGGVLTSPDNLAVARVRRVQISYLTSWQYGHQAYFVRPFRSYETEWEQPCSLAGAAVELLGDPPDPAREVRRTFAFDEQGNQTYQSHETEGGVHGETTQIYENRTNGDWLLGLLRETYVTEGEPNTSPATRVTFQDYDDRGQLRHVEREPFEPALQQTTTLKHDERGLVTKITRSAPGLLDRRTFLFYDEEGVFTTATENELGHVVQQLVHPALGVAVTTRDENGAETHFSYDGFGRIRRVEPDGGIATNIHYSAWGDDGFVQGIKTSAESDDGGAAYRLADTLGRAREEGVTGYDGTWSVSAVDYTAFGQPYLRSSPGVGAPGPATLTRLDTLGRIQSVLPPDGAGTSFTYEMFRTTSVDPKLRVHKTDFDRDGRPSETHEYADDGHDIPLRYRYGDFGQLERIADAAGHVTRLEYDKIGRRISVTDPDRGVVHFEYSAFDETARTWDLVHDIAYAHDPLGRVIRKEDTHGDPAITEISTFDYDSGTGALGRLTRATSPDGIVTELAYNDAGQPISTKWTLGGEVFALEQTYGPGGRPDELHYPEVPDRDRFLVKLHYNEHGYLDTVARSAELPLKPFWQVLARGPDGRLTQAEWHDGPLESRFYDSLSGRLANVRIDKEVAYGADPLIDLRYTYVDGQLDTRVDAVTGRNEHFEYDALDRLKKWTLSGVASRSLAYGYDDFGNLTSVTPVVSGQSQPVELLTYETANRPHAARTRSVGGQPAAQYHYDDRGRLFEGAGRGITWTSFDLPRTVTDAGQTTTFLYDAFGTRVKKTRVAPGKPTETTITIAGMYERRTKGGTTDHRFFVYGDGEPVTEVVYHQQAATEDTHLLGRDGHGSLALVLGSDGTPLEHLYYEPFGGRTDIAGASVGAPTTGVPWGFTGHSEDDDLGLINMGGRVYDPVLRRFLSPDPIVHDLLAGQTLNHYAYVWNNPLRYVDPSGFDGEVAGAPQPEDSNSAIEQVAAEIGSWFADLFAPKQTLFKVKPAGQILPAGPPEATAQVDDVQVDDGSAAKGTAPSAGTSKPVTSQGFHPGILGVHPGVALVAALANSVESNLDHARQAVNAGAHGDGHHAADHVLQIAQDTAEQAGKVLIDAGRGAVALPGDVKDVIGAGNNDERIAAAGDVVEDVVGIGGAVVLLGGASGRPTAGVPQLGGSYASVRATATEAGLGGEVHHMPSWAATTDGGASGVTRGSAPAIWMSSADHAQTPSFRSSNAARAFRAQQATLIRAGRYLDAVKVDIDAIRTVHGDRYDQAIQQMGEYIWFSNQ